MLSTIFSSLIWIGFIEVLALGLLPFWAMLFSSSAERTLGYSRVLSLATLTWFTWFFAQYGGAPFSPVSIIIITLVLLSIGHCSLRLQFSSWQVFLYDQRLKLSYISYTLALLLLIFFRSCSPEIFWGEKPLESSIFNYLIRESSLPAEHPWAAGSSMGYYYLGFFSLAILQKISLLDPAVGFNLSMAFIGASLLACFESLLLNLRLRHLAAGIGAFLLTLGSNLNPVFLSLFESKELNFDLFWLTARNFTSPAFAEYPLWSLLFGDLHPHVMAMPLVVCLLGLTWAAAYQKNNLSSHKIGLTLVCGFFWGILYSVNGWDFVSAAILLSIMFGFSSPIYSLWSWIKLQTGYAVLLGAAAAAAMLPFRFSQENIFAAYWGWVVTTEYNTILHVWLHQGVAVSILVLSSVALFLIKKRYWVNSLIPEKSLMIIALLPVAVGIFSAIDSSSGQAWNIIAFSVSISAFALLLLSTDPDSKRIRFCTLLVITAAALVSISESFYLIDRMNTIFKGYQLLWPLFGVAACVFLHELYNTISVKLYDQNSKLKLITAHSLQAICFAFIAISIFGTAINLKIMLPMKRTSNDRFTLNGTKYLDKENAAEASLIRWLQENVTGIAYIAEASGDGYQAYSRVVMHTGLPTLLGWEHHTRQGGVAQKDIDNRRIALQKIFEEENTEQAYAMLQYYGIDFVFIGKVEQEKYSTKSLSKFSSHPELFIPVAWRGGYTLYLTAFSPLKSEIIKTEL